VSNSWGGTNINNISERTAEKREREKKSWRQGSRLPGKKIGPRKEKGGGDVGDWSRSSTDTQQVPG